MIRLNASHMRAECSMRGTKYDIWLFGGGSLFRSLLEAGLVDTVEVAIVFLHIGSIFQ